MLVLFDLVNVFSVVLVIFNVVIVFGEVLVIGNDVNMFSVCLFCVCCTQTSQTVTEQLIYKQQPL